MKKLLARIILLSVVAFVFVFYYDEIKTYARRINSYSFCDVPIEYRIGSVDNEFDITKAEFLNTATEAASIWNKAYGKTLFTYNPQAELTLNLVYDERQSTLYKIDNIEQQIRQEESLLNIKMEDYEAEKTRLEQDVQQLNEDIQYWNEQGGAPEDKYKELISKQKELNSKINELNRQAQNLNVSTGQFNSKVDTLNSTIDSFNQLLEMKPEQGVYLPSENKIDIYILDEGDRFLHTTAHELGHAMGLGHVTEEGAIMHPLISNETELKDGDIKILNDFCKDRSRLELIKNDVANFVYVTKTKFSQK